MRGSAQTRRGGNWLLCLYCLVVPAGAFYAPGAALPVLDRALACTSALRLRGGARPSSWFAKAATMPSVTPTSATVDAMKCLGNWYVQVAVPTPFDTTAHNGLEEYTWDEKKQRIKVKYTFNDGSFTGKETVVYQKGRVNPESQNGARWQVKPWLGFFYMPIWLDYVVIDIDTTDYSYLVASSPETTGFGSWLYIMTRQQCVTDQQLEPLRASATKAGWDMSKAIRVPQQPQVQPSNS